MTTSIKDSHLALINCIEALEKQEKYKSVVRNNKRETQASCNFAQFSEEEQESLRDDDIIDPPAKKQRSNLHFEEDLAVFSAEEDAEFDDFDLFFVAQDKTGSSMDQVLAEKVNAGLCRIADMEMLGKLIKNFPRPGNIPDLKTRTINKELRKLNSAPKPRDFRIAKLQELVGKSLAAVLNVMHASKTAVKAKNQVQPRTIFEVANGPPRLLISAHDECSQVCREGLKGTLPFQHCKLCDTTLYNKIDNNDFHFGDDMAKKANALVQARKFNQSAPRYSNRSPKNAPRDRLDRSQQCTKKKKKLYVNPFTFKKKAFRDPVKSLNNDQ